MFAGALTAGVFAL